VCHLCWPNYSAAICVQCGFLRSYEAHHGLLFCGCSFYPVYGKSPTGYSKPVVAGWCLMLLGLAGSKF
jgi:hypothetical protein